MVRPNVRSCRALNIDRADISTTAVKSRTNRPDGENATEAIQIRPAGPAISRHPRPIHNHFQLRRHRLSASEYRAARDRAFLTWRDATGAALVG